MFHRCPHDCEMLQRRLHFPTKCMCVCCRWERQKDKLLERGRPIRILGSAVDSPKRAKTVPEPFFVFLRWCISGTPSQSENTGLEKKKKKSLVFSVMFELCWRKQTTEWGVRQLWLNLFLLSVRRPQVNIGFALCAFFSMGSWAFSPSGSPGLQERRYRFLKKENQSQEMHYFIILKERVFPLPPSLEECPRLLSPIICCRLAAAMKPSCRRLRFFTSLEDEETSRRVMEEGKGGN